jgi:probable F420-dependent oxidoreductase
MTTIGLALPQLGGFVSRELVRDFCVRAESLGFQGLWAQDHLLVPVEPRTGYAGRGGATIPEQYRSTLGIFELLAVAAAWTERPLIGTSIVVGGYHRPVELAQSLATLDLLSGGRLVVGVGSGWSEDEHEQMDVDFKSRGRRLDELIAALRACWGPDPVSFDGEFFSIPSAYVSPKPVQDRVRLIGAANSGPALRRVAALCDGWNPVLSMERALALRTELDDQRPTGLDPVSVWLRIFVQFPGGPAWSMTRIESEVAAAAAENFEHVIVDANFSEEIRDASDWEAMLDRLAPLIELAARSSG